MLCKLTRKRLSTHFLIGLTQVSNYANLIFFICWYNDSQVNQLNIIFHEQWLIWHIYYMKKAWGPLYNRCAIEIISSIFPNVSLIAGNLKYHLVQANNLPTSSFDLGRDLVAAVGICCRLPKSAKSRLQILTAMQPTHFDSHLFWDPSIIMILYETYCVYVMLWLPCAVWTIGKKIVRMSIYMRWI